MARGIALRRWQQEALARFESSGRKDFLAVATPGAGKTNFALAACVRALSARIAGRVVVVAPTQHLKYQWAEAARAFGLRLEPEWGSSDGALPKDLHGLVVTYQQVAVSQRALRALAQRAFAILDEIHHAAESRAWGDGIRDAFSGSARRLSLSGTPFRTDQNPIPFVRYDGEQAVPDYEYGYQQALHDGRVVRPVYFPRIDGEMEWIGTDGSTYSHGFEDQLGRVLANQRLRTALSEKNEWLPAVLVRAHRQLAALRRTDPRAGAMAIAMDQAHARSISRILREQVGARATVATSDDPSASRKIAAFASGSDPWIVAVRMVSEGVDIPRLRVGVYATHTLTDLFFRQAVGRLVRWTPGVPRQNAYLFLPADRRLRLFADEIKLERRHSLRKPEPDGEVGERPADEPDPAEASEADVEEQLSLFSVISAVPTREFAQVMDPAAIDLDDDDAVAASEVSARAGLPVLGSDFSAEPVPPAIELDVPPLPGAGVDGPGAAGGDGASEPPLPSSRKDLRAVNAQRAQQIARRSGHTHAEVNAELNRRVGIRRVSEATQAQLARRAEAAGGWLRKLAATARATGARPPGAGET
jgi:superfamily II DNA or RNA helicase